ncbi:Dbl (DH) domain [Trinorchestia longiramus]|nr:Dbl (DH) domain [Trinorchestia longiramus]
MSPDDPDEHIYEELGSIPSSPIQASQTQMKLHRLSKSSLHTSYPNLSVVSSSTTSLSSKGLNGTTNTLTTSQSIFANGQPKQQKLRHALTLPPGLGKSLFDGATKLEILEILKDAKGRLSSAAEEDDDEGPLSGDFSTLAASDSGRQEEAERGSRTRGREGGEEEGEELFHSLRHHSIRASNISSNSDSSESSGLVRTDKERVLSAEVERTDSGVGSETSKSSKLPHHRPLTRVTTLAKHPPLGGSGGLLISSAGVGGIKDPDVPLCADCEDAVEARVTNSGVVYAPLVCLRCSRRRQERREILSEIIETELKYGRDLRIIMDQFYRPIQVAGLLSDNQLNNIFLNVGQLLAESLRFSDQLQDAYDIAIEHGDEDLLTVNIAKIFLDANTMMDAFEYYCIRHGEASVLLQTLEKEKELLRVFLRVSQIENTLLRRMNLHSFLMVPVQRVTKYPLLLSRLYKTTPPGQASRKDCRAAKEELERRLHHMNNETKEASSSKLWRRISMSVGNSTPLRGPRTPILSPHSEDMDKLHKLVVETLEWGAVGGSVVRGGRLLLLLPDSNNWTRRGRANKMVPVYVLLVTRGQAQLSLEDSAYEDRLLTPKQLGVEEAALEPWVLSRCIISWEAETDTECFEVTDLVTKDSFYFKDRDSSGTEDWFRLIQFHAVSVGPWKRRRNALPNLMISGSK